MSQPAHLLFQAHRHCVYLFLIGVVTSLVLLGTAVYSTYEESAVDFDALLAATGFLAFAALTAVCVACAWQLQRQYHVAVLEMARRGPSSVAAAVVEVV